MPPDATAPPAAYLTVRQVADRLALAKADTVLRLIRAGALPAVNVSAGAGRPTWRISPEALGEFLAAHRAVPVPNTPRRRRRKAVKVTSYF